MGAPPAGVRRRVVTGGVEAGTRLAGEVGVRGDAGADHGDADPAPLSLLPRLGGFDVGQAPLAPELRVVRGGSGRGPRCQPEDERAQRENRKKSAAHGRTG